MAIHVRMAFGKIKSVRLAGNKTYFADILTALGLKNLVGGGIPYPLWDRERLLRARPQKVFLVFPSSTSSQKVLAVQKAWRELGHPSVEVVHGDFALIPGPRILKLMTVLKHLI